MQISSPYLLSVFKVIRVIRQPHHLACPVLQKPLALEYSNSDYKNLRGEKNSKYLEIAMSL